MVEAGPWCTCVDRRLYLAARSRTHLRHNTYMVPPRKPVPRPTLPPPTAGEPPLSDRSLSVDLNRYVRERDTGTEFPPPGRRGSSTARSKAPPRRSGPLAQSRRRNASPELHSEPRPTTCHASRNESPRRPAAPDPPEPPGCSPPFSRRWRNQSHSCGVRHPVPNGRHPVTNRQHLPKGRQRSASA